MDFDAESNPQEKNTGFVEEEEDVACLHWPVQTNLARFFIFSILLALPI